MQLMPLGSLGAVETDGAVTFGLWLPWVSATDGNAVTVKIIHETDQFLQDVPAILLTYDFYDRAEASAVRALAGEAAIGGRLPIELPGLAKVGSGLDRPASASTATK